MNSVNRIVSDAYAGYLQSLVAGDLRACRTIVQGLLDMEVDIRSLYTELFQRALYEVGDMWARNQISVAIEHMATAITESLFPLVYPKIFMEEHCGKKAIISCVANEFHQIGGKMVADVLELNHWDAYFLGANTPVCDLMDLILDKKPEVVGLSLSLYANLPELMQVIDAVRRRYPSLPLLIGGQAFRFGGEECLASYEQVSVIRSLWELEDYLPRFGHAA